MIDAYSETWRSIADEANKIIEAARARLEYVDQTHDQTQFERGRISAMREILAIAKPKPITATDAIPNELRPRDRSGI